MSIANIDNHGKLFVIASRRTRDGGMGCKQNLLYRFKEDMKWFRSRTMGKMKKGSVVIMGRKTFESLPKILPKRIHIVISTSEKPDHLPDTVHWRDSLAEAINLAYTQWLCVDKYVIGGASVYRQMWKYTPIVILTEITDTRPLLQQPVADTIFPDLPPDYFTTKSTKYEFSKSEPYLKYAFFEYQPRA